MKGARAVTLLNLGLCLMLATAAFADDRHARSFVMLGGSRIHYELQGKGSPCLVLVSGVGCPAEVWDAVFPRLARLSATLRYSRAGLGSSTFAGTDKRTLDDLVKELDELLGKLQVPKPFVLVGHSYGGLIIRAFAAAHPDQVAGLLFVDSTFEDYFPVLETLEPRAREFEMNSVEKELHELPPGSAVRLEVESLFALWDRRALMNDLAAARIPTIVLTSVRVDPDDPLRSNGRFMQARYDAHHRWLNPLAWGMHLTTPYSGHFIQFDEPDLIVQAAGMLLAFMRAQEKGAHPAQ